MASLFRIGFYRNNELCAPLRDSQSMRGSESHLVGLCEETLLKLFLRCQVGKYFLVVVPGECWEVGESGVSSYLARILLPSLSRMRRPFTVSMLGSSRQLSMVMIGLWK